MYVCVCNTVSDRRIREAVAAGASSFEALQATLGVSTCCGCCEPEVREMLAEQPAKPERCQPAPAELLYHPA
ncbi:MAG TPA: (2Fe-2S)-binding protein [Gammaproteobacteria bacterium]|nr:(2Fe-2S)-binding protein [Gammaproteobacteria bacterium]